MKLAAIAAIACACNQRDPARDHDELVRFGKEQAAKQRAAHPPAAPAVLAQIDLAARKRALDGAWLVPMEPGVVPLALELHGDRGILVDADGDHDAKIAWPLPCEVDVTIAIDTMDEIFSFTVVPTDDGARLVSGTAGERVGDATIACTHGTLYVLDAAGACTHWLPMSSGLDWIHAPDDCSFLTALPADGPRRWTVETRALAATREPDLAAARAARGR